MRHDRRWVSAAVVAVGALFASEGLGQVTVSRRGFAADGTFVALTSNGFAPGVVQAVRVMRGSTSASPDATMTGDLRSGAPALAVKLEPVGPVAVGDNPAQGCGGTYAPPVATTTYKLTLPPQPHAGGGAVRQFGLVVDLRVVGSGRLSWTALGGGAAVEQDLQLDLARLLAAWIPTTQDVVVLEFEREPDGCEGGGGAREWASFDLKALTARLSATGAVTGGAQVSEEQAAAQRVRAAMAQLGREKGWTVAVRAAGGFAIGEATREAPEVGGGPHACDDASVAWTSLHKTFVATGRAVIEVAGSPIGDATDIDGDGRPDLLVAFEDECGVQGNFGGVMMEWVIFPRGDFRLVVDRGDRLELVKPRVLPKVPDAWRGTAWTTASGKPAVAATAVGRGSSPGGEDGPSYVFQWSFGKLGVVHKSRAAR